MKFSIFVFVMALLIATFHTSYATPVPEDVRPISPGADHPLPDGAAVEGNNGEQVDVSTQAPPISPGADIIESPKDNSPTQDTAGHTGPKL